jgi:hypothetical protein
LLVEGDRDPLRRLVVRLRALGSEVVPVENVEEAIRRLDEGGGAAHVVFLPMHPGPRLARLLDAVRQASRRSGVSFVAVGRRPSAEEREILRLAGVGTCLQDPVAESQLRFAVNQAGYEDRDGRCRKSVRVPTALAARVIGGMGAREALVYSLSEGGAYLETPRVTVAGAQLTLQLPLPAGTVSVDAHVLYHNVVGNLQQENLATGMGVEFIDMDEETREAIADYVDECVELQTGLRPPKRIAPPVEEEAQPEAESRYPWLESLKENPWFEVVKGLGQRYARERAEPEPIHEVYAPSPAEASPKPEHHPKDAGNRVVVRCQDGRLIKGYTLDFMPNKNVFHVVSPDDESEITELSLTELKAIFFVKDFAGDPDGASPKSFTRDELRGLHGVKLEVRFLDGEVMYGTTHGYQPGRKGFFLFPADETSNNIRVYIYEDATDSVKVLR